MNVPIDISNVTLHTQRLTLRSWKESDVHDLYEYARVDGVGQMAGWKPHENIEESRMILKMFIDEKKTFALEYEGKVIGSLGIEEYNEEHFPEFKEQKAREIGYVLSKNYWGQGLMPEAVREAIRYLFEDVGLDVIFCGHFLWNRQSQRAQKKCGFHHYAYDTFETRLGTIEDNEVNILTKEEYYAKERNSAEIVAS
ncbi:MAG: GNAT family N-acetyltransferase [Erysipelotrichaceae bacterium]|nr:GNAT family N-acetyltransferase [Erysipelotrichaceae bacterium]